MHEEGKPLGFGAVSGRWGLAVRAGMMSCLLTSEACFFASPQYPPQISGPGKAGAMIAQSHGCFRGGRRQMSRNVRICSSSFT